jgi:MraZ protein
VLTVFTGVHHLSLDNKFRLLMPARQRERLQEQCGGQLIATIDPQSPCLLIYPFPTWQQIQPQILALPSLDIAARWHQRALLGHAIDIECDASGRVLIPPSLRPHAELEKEKKAVLVGQGNKLELWNENIWIAERDKWLELAREQRSLSPEMLRLSL